jgi:hypothetical protein
LIPKDDMASRVEQAILGLEDWLDSQRTEAGYGGPVVHWWWDSMEYKEAALDWRYEGIIIGYLNLWNREHRIEWLEKAQSAGNDLVRGQLPSGNYRNSLFELNPGSGGTPHEAACDLALLNLSAALRDIGDPSADIYFQTAERNLQDFYITQLWDPTSRSFRDDQYVQGFVPNKSATLIEALFAYASLANNTGWVDTYALPTLDLIINHQVKGGNLDGAIAQNSLGVRQVNKYFPLYIARCLPALLEGYRWSGAEIYLQSAISAARFVISTQYPDGSFPQVLYPKNRRNRYPQWIAGVSDILRPLGLMRLYEVDFDETASLGWLLDGVRPDGGIWTAIGFGQVAPFGKSDDPRDKMSVCGWAGKAFRYLTGRLTP